jgi:hypothetical protein
MKCLYYTLKYTGQTGRTFDTRYKKHIQAIRNNHSNSRYSNHILNILHKYDTITDRLDFIRAGKKGKHLNTLERYHIYLTKKDNFHMNEIHINNFHSIFETLYEPYNREQHVKVKVKVKLSL